MLARELSSLTRPVRIDSLEDESEHAAIDADADDRERLARHYGIADIAYLRGDLDIERRGAIIRVAGTLEAELGRTCVVSLEPMRETIIEPFAVEYTTAAPPPMAPTGEVEADLDAPEPLDADHLDLGDVLLEQLVLSMSPHPKKPGAQPPADPGAGRETSPFDVLKTLKE